LGIFPEFLWNIIPQDICTTGWAKYQPLAEKMDTKNKDRHSL